MRAKLRFYGFLSFVWTFAHNVAQNWLVLHETSHTTLFGMYYSVEVVRFENNSNMLNITRQVAIFWVFKLFLDFRAQSSSNLVCFA